MRFSTLRIAWRDLGRQRAAVLERRREFAVVAALGVNRCQMALLVASEALALGLPAVARASAAPSPSSSGGAKMEPEPFFPEWTGGRLAFRTGSARRVTWNPGPASW